MEDFDCGKKTIMQIFEDYWYCIPNYQRPYVWEQENVYQLLNDINTYRNANKKKYLIGSLILFNDKNKSSEMEIIDGQQRITTLSLIHHIICQNNGFLQSNRDLIYNHEESLPILQRIIRQ